jgi:hypothetical protein
VAYLYKALDPGRAPLTAAWPNPHAAYSTTPMAGSRPKPEQDIIAANIVRLSAARDLPPTLSTFVPGSTIGSVVRTYFELVTTCIYGGAGSGADSGATTGDSFVTINSTRAMYLASMSARPPGEPKAESTRMFARSLQTAKLWECLTRDLIAMATGRVPPSECEPDEGGGTAFERLMREDECKPFDFSGLGEQASPSPLTGWTLDMVHGALERWYDRHPFGFLVNDALLLDQLDDASYDPALLCFILGSETLSSIQVSFDSAEHRVHGAELLEYAQRTVFERLVSFPGQPGASSGITTGQNLGTVQCLVLWGLHEMSTTQTRRALALFYTAHMLARHLLRTRAHTLAFPAVPGRPPTREQVETELLGRLGDTLAGITAWTLLGIDIPSAGLVDLLPCLNPMWWSSPSSSSTNSATTSFQHSHYTTVSGGLASPTQAPWWASIDAAMMASSSPGKEWRQRVGPRRVLAGAEGHFARRCARAQDDAACALGCIVSIERVEADTREKLGLAGPVGDDVNVACGMVGGAISGLETGQDDVAVERPLDKFHLNLAEHLLGRAWREIKAGGRPDRRGLFIAALW